MYNDHDFGREKFCNFVLVGIFVLSLQNPSGSIFSQNYWDILEKAMAPQLQYSCLENPMDGGAWKAAVHGVAEGRI